jgi:citrate synthase
MPVLDSAISLIADERLYYRGVDATELASTRTIEEVASLLWTGDLAEPFPDDVPELSPKLWADLRRIAAKLPPLEALGLFLPVAAVADSAAFDLRPEAVRRAGARIVRLLAAAAAGTPPSARPLARTLERAWAGGRRTTRLLDAAMILCADHELNVSTFTARCAASAGSNPYGVVTAGLAALRGFRHGGMTERVDALFDEAAAPRGARTALEGRLRRGEELPGFGHPIYPSADPRAAFLVERALAERAKSAGGALARALVAAARDLTGQAPNLDFALVTLARALDLPRSAALVLLALGRAVGWIAHAIEQIDEGRLIRPRARYVGVPPASRSEA